MVKQVRQYGTWPSPISPKAVASSLRLSDVQWDTASDALVWLEGRGAQGVLVMQSGVDAPRDLTSDLSVRAYVGYGGGDFTVAGGYVYFAGPEGRLYKQSLAGDSARAVTPAFGHAAAPRVSVDGKWLVYVHTYERVDGLVLIDTNGELWPRKLAFGTDFVMQPAWHPQGTHIAYVAWNHPQMPWDGTELRLATLSYGSDGVPGVASVQTVVGNTTTAIFQPEFSPDGRYLAYISDESGWGQLYLYDLAQKTHRAVTDAQAEHGQPAWVQGLRMYGWAADGHSLYYLRNDLGFFGLYCYDVRSDTSSRMTALDGYTHMMQLATSPRHNAVAVIASSSKTPQRVITYEPQGMHIPPVASLPDTPTIQVVVNEPAGERIYRRAATENFLETQLSQVQAITWKGHDGEAVHGLYYPPTSDAYEGVGAPPLIVNVHGGPTGQVTAGYNSDAQFFASRGYAVLEVNYRGGTGYGKAYMNKLRGSWGIYDVEDSVTGACYLADQGLADASRFIIKGGSAGGFTVLQSLVEKPGFYKAGVCLFGVSNHFLLALETHKFEERYLDSILGPLPQAADIYRERSPYFHANKIVDPLAVFQGEDDVVVPKNQSDMIVASLKARNIPHEYHVYPGEGHGWRKVETIDHYYNAVLKFLTQHVLYA